jgi:transcriptional regulator with XRE-family HTH domain
MSISDQLKKAIKQSGFSMNQIAKAADVPRPAISYFLSAKPKQQRDIRLATADKLATFFGLELTETASKPAASPERRRQKSATPTTPSRRPAEKKKEGRPAAKRKAKRLG